GSAGGCAIADLSPSCAARAPKMRCTRSSCRATPAMPSEEGVGAPPELTGAEAHYRALESLYRAAPINGLFPSRLEIVEAGVSRIRYTMDADVHHAAGAAHGSSYFKMLDDAAFYAANSLVSDRFLLTTA